MIKLYWRPKKVSRAALVSIAALSSLALLIVERFPVETRGRWYEEKLAASKLSADALSAIGAERKRRGHKPDLAADPTGSGLLGELVSPVTSSHGSLRAKQASVDPNFAAVVVDMLQRAGLEEGDTVAVGISGSFPAMNVSVMAALHTLKLRPLIISSNAASQWGANTPDFLWIEWERVLVDQKKLPFRSIAASMGGIEDRGLGIPLEGRQLISAAIASSGVPALEPKDYAESIELRLARYREAAAGAPIKAYVNVGGGTTSVGTKVGKHVFKSGLNLRPPVGGPGVDSIMSRFADDGVPVIHLVNIQRLARRYGLSDPQAVGKGGVFSRAEYDRRLAGGFLALILAALYAFVRSDVGLRWIARGRGERAKPEPMV